MFTERTIHFLHVFHKLQTFIVITINFVLFCVNVCLHLKSLSVQFRSALVRFSNLKEKNFFLLSISFYFIIGSASKLEISNSNSMILQNEQSDWSEFMEIFILS